jgi:predicted ATPase
LRLPFEFLDRRPIVVALAGSNGAGKSTFYEAFLVDSGLRFVTFLFIPMGIVIHQSSFFFSGAFFSNADLS